MRFPRRRSAWITGHDTASARKIRPAQPDSAFDVRPARIMMVDVEKPAPRFAPDGQFRDAWTILCLRHVPRAIVVLDLSASTDVNETRLQEEYAKILTSHRDEPVLTPSTATPPRISVVVPTIASNIEELSQCVDHLAQLEYPDYEVLLIDNRRTVPNPDPLDRLTRDKPWIRVFREERPGISAARNKGINESSGELIAFTDDDVRVDRQWLQAIADRLVRDPTLDAITGLVLPAELESAAQIWYEQYFGGFGGVRSFQCVTVQLKPVRTRFSIPGRLNELDTNERVLRRSSLYGVGRYVAGANMAFRRTALARIRGFDVALGTGTPSRGGEDLAAIISVLWSGGRVGFEPAAFVFHKHRKEYAQLLTQLDGSGIGFTAMLTSLVRRDPRHFVAMLAQLPLASARLVMQSAQRTQGKPINGRGLKNTSRAHSYPSRLFYREFTAYFRGPITYVQSVIDVQRFREH
ncbi:MAG: glycosyltransferase [Acidobacteria bacterium]|nr:glycosyltransferase [Acidobacteriota bacterium]